MNLSLSDLTYKYKTNTDSQAYINSKYEFSSLKTKYKNLYRHQEIIKRLILFKDRLLLFHPTGTGKSCSAFGSSEQFTDFVANIVDDFVKNYMTTNRSTIKRIFFLTKGGTLISSARKELVCKCIIDKYKYLTPDVLDSSTEKIMRIRVKNEIEKYYSFESYYSFTSRLKDISDEEIKREYSHCLYIVDEVHTLSTEDIDEGEDESEKIYEILHKVFHIVEHSKIILMSATPMVDKPNEIEFIMNLLLPLNRQMHFKDYSKLTIKDFEPYFKGYISYVPSSFEDEEIETKFMGESIKKQKIKEINKTFNSKFSEIDTKVKVYYDYLYDFQLNAYKESFEKNKTNFFAAERQLLNFAPPSDDFLKKTRSESYVFNDSKITKKTLKEYGTKIDSVVNECINEFGLRYIYSNFVKNGVYILAASFSLHNVDQYNGNTSAFREKRNVFNYCPVPNESRTLSLDKKLRFAMITSDTSPIQIERILDLYNSYENRFGDYLKIIILSPKTQIGISLLSVVVIHILDPYWNFSVLYQAYSRGIRMNSLVYILDYLIKHKLVRKIYLHCATSENIATVDEMLYILGEEKDINIKYIERIMKIYSIDCLLNNRSDDISVCDYQECSYQCLEESNDKIEYDSYDVLYSEDLLNKIITKIKDIFRDKTIVSLTYIKKIIGIEITDKQLLLAIEKLYDEKDVIINKYGLYNYFYVNGDYLILSNDYPDSNSQENTIINGFYNNNLIFTHERTLDDFLYTKLSKKANKDSSSIEEQSIYLEKLIIKGNPIPDKFKQYIFELNYPQDAIDKMNQYLLKGDRKKLNIHIKALNQLDYSGDQPVILNTLLTKSSGYRATVNTITRDLRILDVNNPKRGFRFTDKVETIIFSYIIFNTSEEQTFDAEIYGSISNTDNQFRIYYDEQKDKKSLNKREEIRGRKCMTYDISKLIEIVFKLEIKDTAMKKFSNRKSIDEIIQYLNSKDANIEGKSESYIREFYNWYTKKSKIEICNAIKDNLERKGLVKTI